MSATQALPAAAAAPRRQAFTGRVTQLGVLRSEWTKLRSLRSTRWSLLFAFVTMADTAEANAAMTALNGKEVGGRTLNVNEARAREERPRPYAGERR